MQKEGWRQQIDEIRAVRTVEQLLFSLMWSQKWGQKPAPKTGPQYFRKKERLPKWRPRFWDQGVAYTVSPPLCAVSSGDSGTFRLLFLAMGLTKPHPSFTISIYIYMYIYIYWIGSSPCNSSKFITCCVVPRCKSHCQEHETDDTEEPWLSTRWTRRQCPHQRHQTHRTLKLWIWKQSSGYDEKFQWFQISTNKRLHQLRHQCSRYPQFRKPCLSIAI